MVAKIAALQWSLAGTRIKRESRCSELDTRKGLIWGRERLYGSIRQQALRVARRLPANADAGMRAEV